jgi:hypothetical protein
MDDYLAKPIQRHEVRMALERWLGKSPETGAVGPAASAPATD